MAATHTDYRPGVDSDLTVDSRLTAGPPKPTNEVSTAYVRPSPRHLAQEQPQQPRRRECLREVAALPGRVAMRDSKDPTGPVLAFTRAEWRAFLGSIHTGDLG